MGWWVMMRRAAPLCSNDETFRMGQERTRRDATKKNPCRKRGDGEGWSVRGEISLRVKVEEDADERVKRGKKGKPSSIWKAEKEKERREIAKRKRGRMWRILTIVEDRWTLAKAGLGFTLFAMALLSFASPSGVRALDESVGSWRARWCMPCACGRAERAWEREGRAASWCWRWTAVEALLCVEDMDICCGCCWGLAEAGRVRVAIYNSNGIERNILDWTGYGEVGSLGQPDGGIYISTHHLTGATTAVQSPEPKKINQ